MTAVLPEPIYDHSFLAEELLIPNVNKIDGSRCNMVCSHVTQVLILENAETPLVFANFENQVGQYSTGFKEVPEGGLEVMKIFEFNDYRKLILTRNAKNEWNLIEWKAAVNLTEAFGYINTLNENVVEGAMLDDSQWIMRNGMYDDNLNFQMGVNLNTLYLPFKGYTFEDAVVISDEAAAKLTHNDVSIFYVVLNRNDVLTNRYGTKLVYQALPAIGQPIAGGILCSRRRINYSTILDEFKDTEFSNQGPDDVNFFANGTVTDIEVFCNTPEDLEYPYNNDFKIIADAQRALYTELLEWCQAIRADDENVVLEDLSFWHQKARDYLDDDIPHNFDKRVFEGIVVKVTVTNEIKCQVGSKITGRYGNKGVISKILPKSEMPISEDGLHQPDVLLNSLGVNGRMNPAQLFEQELNFIAHSIWLRYYETEDFEAFIQDVLEMYRIASPQLYNWLMEFEQDDETYRQYFVEAIENEFIPIHQPPFYGNSSPGDMIDLYTRFPISKVKFKDIHDSLVIGKMYYIKLKHESEKKFSARSTGQTSLLDVPYRSNEKYKKGNALYNTNPVKMGKQFAHLKLF